MTVYDTIKARGSIRRYKPDPIPENVLNTILDAARLAQSAANRQPWEFIVITERGRKQALVSAAGQQRFVGEAAAVVVCLANPNESVAVGSFNGFLMDLGIAIENMALTAWDMGVGSCWIGAYNEAAVRSLFGIPDSLRVVSMLTLGYPAEKPSPKVRKALSEILHREKYDDRR
jgi:nitroreductase